jgi:tetratricopeptide (TPR) repeat protein
MKKAGPPVGVVIVTVILAIVAISNLDLIGKKWYQDGSLVPSITCYEAYCSLQTVLGVKSERLAHAWAELAHAYEKVPRYRDAVRAEEQAIKVRSQLLGPTNPNVLILKAHLGEYLAEQKKYKEADQYLAATLQEACSVKQPEPISKAYILEAQAKSFMLQKRWQEAETAALQIIPIDDRLMALGHSGFDGRELLAEIYAKSDRTLEALLIAQEALDSKQKQLKDSNISLAIAHETLGKVLILTKQPDAAETEFKNAYALLEKEYAGDRDRLQYWKSRYSHLLTEPAPFEN